LCSKRFKEEEAEEGRERRREEGERGSRRRREEGERGSMKEGRKEERETKRYDYCVAEHRDHSNVTVVCSLSSSTFDILVAEAPMPKPADNPMANDPLLGRQLRAPDVDDPDVGTVLSVVLKKPAGKKKRTYE